VSDFLFPVDGPAVHFEATGHGTSGSTAFDRLRTYLLKDPAVRIEMENAFSSLTERINVSDRGSRFVAGATGEWIIAAACYSAGIIAFPEGHNADGFDLAGVQAAAQGLFSVKCSFSKTSGFRITNGINGSGKGFVEPTIFAHQRLGGLVFADPGKHVALAAKAQKKPDAVVLSLAAIIEHARENPSCVVAMSIPLNQGRGTYDPALEFVRSLLTGEGHYPNLSRVFEDVKRQTAGTSVAAEIRDLKALRDQGVLSQEQFERAVDKLVTP